jgi:hypothetical protein
MAERKVHRRQLTDDGNVEINGRDLRETNPAARGQRPSYGLARALTKDDPDRQTDG